MIQKKPITIENHTKKTSQNWWAGCGYTHPFAKGKFFV